MFKKSLVRKTPYTRMFTAILVVLTLAATSSIISVNASPITITVMPTSGPVGSTMTVSGQDASPNGEVTVYLATFVFIATTTANETGGYFVNITVPAIPAGIYDIMVLDVTTGDTSSASFTVQPKIVLTPEEGSYEDTVTVEGSGFRGSTLITLAFNETDVTPFPPPFTDGLGSFRASFNVSATPNGTYPVTADDGINNASTLFTVIPKITLMPQTSGPPSTLLMVMGTGFAPSVGVEIEFDETNVTIYGGMVTQPMGSFFLPAFFVPDVPDGTYTVTATDDTGISATAPFTVPSPILTLTPNITSGSSTVTATGSGFPPNTPILLYLEDVLLVNLMDLTTESPTLSADEYGEYEYSFIVPVAKPGVYTVAAYLPVPTNGFAVGEEVASASLTIVEDALLLDIQDEIATIIIPDLGTIKANLTAIDVRLVSIEGGVATIETDIGTMKANLTDISAALVSIEGGVATIETDIGTIKANLTDINAELVSIEGSTATINSAVGLIQTDITDIELEVTEINGDTATIQTTLGTIEGKITSIEGNTATIETDVGTVKADISTLQGTQESFTLPLYADVALASVAAAGAILLLILMRRKNSVQSENSSKKIHRRAPSK